MNRKMKLVVSGIMVIMIGFISGCSGTSKDSNVIRIGSMFELTGSAAEYGISMNNAVNDINEAGGVDGKLIEVVERDIASDEAQAAQTAMALLNQY
ncbi:ABC transporter substrate-binding protein [Fundicoccus ignavus]|nr:ABC transporter substrate-binding protein [Fundicoccus ignavus]